MLVSFKLKIPTIFDKLFVNAKKKCLKILANYIFSTSEQVTYGDHNKIIVVKVKTIKIITFKLNYFIKKSIKINKIQIRFAQTWTKDKKNLSSPQNICVAIPSSALVDGKKYDARMVRWWLLGNKSKKLYKNHKLLIILNVCPDIATNNRHNKIPKFFQILQKSIKINKFFGRPSFYWTVLVWIQFDIEIVWNFRNNIIQRLHGWRNIRNLHLLWNRS